jgi:hypothetical protein
MRAEAAHPANIPQMSDSCGYFTIASEALAIGLAYAPNVAEK